MILTDTHTHLYLNAFNEDRNEVVLRAINQGIKFMLLPNIDSSSVEGMLDLCMEFPKNCHPMMGLHPTSVKENYKDELEIMENWINKRDFIAIGETGIDLYWDKTFIKEQEIVFRRQLEISFSKDLPVVIHSRDSFDVIMKILNDYKGKGLRGVFHCFTGTIEQAKKILDFGFMLGIGGVVTFKNSGLDQVIEHIGIESLLLETDAPFLAPVPYRGKRNESSYIHLILNKISQIKNIDKEEVGRLTTQNANRLFNISIHE